MRKLLVAVTMAAVFAGEAAAATPVPSLQPQATAKLWARLVREHHPHAAGACRPLRAVFYAQTDWLRLATKLAANASPCAQYYISIPPLAADKTAFRNDQAWRIRALGTSFHVLAEINFTGWSQWVAANGGDWHAAGVEVRRRMAAAGYDVKAGDTWVVNEFSSAVRRGLGTARDQVRALVRGLYEGDVTLPAAKGAVFIVGVGQNLGDATAYKATIQSWLQDAPFWGDMSTYVSDWGQELYGDLRNYGVPGAPLPLRRDHLNDYLQHELTLANAGPPDTLAAARSFLQATYSPLANAAWEWDNAYGWTAVPYDQMQNYVSAQVYALRYVSQAAPFDHFGLAWSPKNLAGLSAADFANQTSAILDRLGAAIHDSASTPEAACGPTGQNLWCNGQTDGAAFTEAWKTFATWTGPGLNFTSTTQTLTAGQPSAVITLQLTDATGAAAPTPTDLAVTVTSSSPRGTFATTPTGPWQNALTLTSAAGQSVSPAFYYEDTLAGAPTIAAGATGFNRASQVETVTAGPAATVTVSPASVRVVAGATQPFTAKGVDAFGNAVTATANWATTAPGTVAPANGASTTFTADTTPGSGVVTATIGTVSGSAAVTVAPRTLHVAGVRYDVGIRSLYATVILLDDRGRRVPGATLALFLYHGSKLDWHGTRLTSSLGSATVRRPAKTGCYRMVVKGVTAPGFRWDGVTPLNRFCR